MRKTLFDAGPPSVTSAGKRVSASTQAGASCVFELRDVVWRRSSHALDGMGWGSAIIGGGAGRPSVKASCALTRQAAAIRIANARDNINSAEINSHPTCFASSDFQWGLICKLCVISNTADRMLNT